VVVFACFSLRKFSATPELMVFSKSIFYFPDC
jgi:hypothetical protein